MMVPSRPLNRSAHAESKSIARHSTRSPVANAMEHVEPIERDTDFERPVDPRRTPPPRRNWWPLVMIAAVLLAAFFAWRRWHVAEQAPVPASPPAPPVASQPAPTPSSPRFPIESAAPAAEPSAPLPAVGDSDAPLQDLMATLFAGAPLDRIFHLQEIVPRFVATIDNLPRQTVALSRMSVKPIGGNVETTQADGRILLRADNAARYAPYLRVMEQADSQKLVQAYVRFYPLFQKAYEDLGYPHGYFNDRLVEVIDHLLATPDVPAPVALSQPKVLYEFADPALEQRSAGQKILMRMGPVNEARVKAKLREIRQGVTGQALPR